MKSEYKQAIYYISTIIFLALFLSRSTNPLVFTFSLICISINFFIGNHFIQRSQKLSDTNKTPKTLSKEKKIITIFTISGIIIALLILALILIAT